MILFTAFALQVAAPQPGELRSFHDWTVGCDNVRACHATSLVDLETGDPALPTLSLRRSAGGRAEPVFALDAREDLCGSSLIADGQQLPVRLIEAAQCSIVHPEDAPALVAALRSARELRMVGADGTPLGAVLLAGASAAMLYMDEAQGRLDTITALVRGGDRPASAVPSAPPLPVIRAAPMSQESAALDTARIMALRREVSCTIDEVGGPDEATLVPLEPGKTLLLLACGSGAYNVSIHPFIVQYDARDRPSITPARFDRDTGQTVNDVQSMTNAEWDYERGLLREFPRGRGLGDCGGKYTHVWDGERFRLVREEVMGECRGVYDFITTWRARVVRP